MLLSPKILTSCKKSKLRNLWISTSSIGQLWHFLKKILTAASQRGKRVSFKCFFSSWVKLWTFKAVLTQLSCHHSHTNHFIVFSPASHLPLRQRLLAEFFGSQSFPAPFGAYSFPVHTEESQILFSFRTFVRGFTTFHRCQLTRLHPNQPTDGWRPLTFTFFHCVTFDDVGIRSLDVSLLFDVNWWCSAPVHFFWHNSLQFVFFLNVCVCVHVCHGEMRSWTQQ